ncbi:hypothetical protein [Ruegeria profundi]|uniref:hypothetical protein n=1 Tax=Ruegeria profundi TaxID=1685378 RepID=UPI003C7A40A8
MTFPKIALHRVKLSPSWRHFTEAALPTEPPVIIDRSETKSLAINKPDKQMPSRQMRRVQPLIWAKPQPEIATCSCSYRHRRIRISVPILVQFREMCVHWEITS